MYNNRFSDVAVPGQDARSVGVPQHVVDGLDGIAHHAFEIDPRLADTAEFTAEYGWPADHAANTIVVRGKRDGEVRTAVCVALASTKLDLNRAVKAALGVRKVSFAPMDSTVAETSMEPGSITPFGTPVEWPILVDARVFDAGLIVLGGGKRLLKLVIDSRSLQQLPNARIVPGLAVPR